VSAQSGLSLYDSKRQQKLAFKPLVEGEVSLYVCGPTVQSAPHAGHLRSALVYDLMSKWFSALGYRVKLVRNITDIDDKILENARAQSIDWQQLAREMTVAFKAGYDKLAIATPSAEPLATDHIASMQKLISLLIDKGHAYRANDGSANVYFATQSWPSYGELTNQKPEDMDSSDELLAGKVAANDFALWKASKPEEPETAAWDSPWGKGRPGWHIECTAIALEYLEPSDLDETLIDIQGGGSDLIFPHHEMCATQAQVITGKELASTYVHAGMIGLDGEKMSKSKGNLVFVSRLVASGVDPMAIRWALMSDHYRSDRMWSDAVLHKAQGELDQLKLALSKSDSAPTEDVIDSILIALSDDLDTTLVLSRLNAWASSSIAGSQGGNSDDLRNVLDVLLGLKL